MGYISRASSKVDDEGRGNRVAPEVRLCIRSAEEFRAHRVLDIGCGTGVFALLLADRGIEVAGVDPVQASIDVARAKPGSERVRWICCDLTALPPLQVDLATMTGNVAQAIVDPQSWQKTLRGPYEALRPGGLLVFRLSRDPAVYRVGDPSGALLGRITLRRRRFVRFGRVRWTVEPVTVPALRGYRGRLVWWALW
ncbi:class I SAM-dependent methyltransferase [Streptomyces sp. TRM68367]|nr:class I SAM-dependent methyltransferase [Streptomyces sp. TRM68367]